MAAVRWRRFLFLGGAVLLLLVLLTAGVCGSSSSHSLRYFYTAVSVPGLELPQFITVGYVDDQPIDQYDSITKRDVPQAPWMEEARKEDPKYWEKQTRISRGAEIWFRQNLVQLQKRFHQNNSAGIHTWQLMYGCEVGPDGSPSRACFQYAYDGEDFISLDRETVTWTARVPQALPTKRRWEGEVDEAQRSKDYLEGDCVKWLQKFLQYGKETLLRTEAPTGRVVRKKGYDGQETLDCQLYGFYPKDIDVTWMKDEVGQGETLTVGIIPNSDGTYYTSLRIDIDAKDRDRYRCWVEHDSLPKPLDLAWEEPASSVGLIVGIVVGVLVAILLVSGVAFFIRHRRSEPQYKATPGSDWGSDSSSRVIVPEA